MRKRGTIMKNDKKAKRPYAERQTMEKRITQAEAARLIELLGARSILVDLFVRAMMTLGVFASRKSEGADRVFMDHKTGIDAQHVKINRAPCAGALLIMVYPETV